MADQKLTYKVSVEEGDAARALDRVGKAGQDAAQDITEGFDKASTRSTAAIRTMMAELDKMESDAKAAAAAVSAIKAELTIEVDDSTIDRFLSNTKSKMGLTFDEMTADAKQFADVLERGVNMDRTRSELRGVGDEMGHVRSESDQSRSVLANLAGNAAQDFGELGGVVGTLGVGVGQLAEYAVDGNIAMSNLAGVAGPMAGLALATVVVSDAVKQIGVEQKETTEQTAAYREELQKAGSAAQNVADMVREAGTLSFADNNADTFLRDLAEVLPVVGEGTVNVADIMARASLNVDDYSRAVTGVGSSWNDTITALSLARASGAISADEWRDVVAEMEDQRNRIGAAGSDTAAFFADSVDSMNQAFQRLQAQEDPFSVMGAKWRVLIDDLRDGKVDTQEAVDATRELADELGKDPGEILDIAWKGLNKTWDEATESADKAREAQKAAAKAARESAIEVAQAAGVVNDAIREGNQIVSSAAFNATSIDATASAMGSFFDTMTTGQHAVAGVNDALDGLQAAFEAQSKVQDSFLPDLSTPEGRATFAALEQLGQSLIPDIQKAFDDSDGSVAKFSTSMTALYSRTLAQLINQLGLSEDQAKELLKQIGLVPDNFETQYELIGAEDASAKLALLSGTLDSLPKFVQSQVQMAIIAGDPQKALDIIQGYLNTHTTKALMDLNTQGAEESYEEFKRRVERNELLARIRVTYTGLQRNSGGGQVGQGGAVQLAAPAALSAGLSAVPLDDGAGGVVMPAAAVAPSITGTVMVTPPARPVTLNVNVSAGVIGNRFELQRVVTRAARSAVRLGGAAVLVGS